jgi:rhamnogalacturonyl hydrolase YesR
MMEATLPDSLLPRTTNPDGTLRTNKPNWWTSGFYPGTLWYLYQFSADSEIKQIAQKRLKIIETQKYNERDHDIGFKILCSYGNAWQATGDSVYYYIILTAAATATLRFNESVGLIRSWDAADDTTQYRVIVDNMMNLELLFWATRHTGDSTYYKIAISHADKTMHNHYRVDGSSWHLVNYDQKSGEVLAKRTVQGYNDESAWARGQAWGLYGFVMCYRETGNKKYLQHAEKIAQFLINHPDLPQDGVPYWDFNAPDIPDALRDASAVAIISSAMIELSQFADNHSKMEYLNFAHNVIRTLSTEEYRSKTGSNNNFLLMHGVGHLPEKSEVDVPLSYADYYYVEALMRIREMQLNH